MYIALYTVWKMLQFSLTHFWQKIREINGFTKEITKELIWRNIFLVRLNFSFFHTVLWKLRNFTATIKPVIMSQKFRQINFFVNISCAVEIAEILSHTFFANISWK